MEQQKTYYHQLDALRAIAVLLVLASHWLDVGNIINRYSPNGTLGVTLFFVLSGFLITGILIDNKRLLDQGASLRQILKIFYIRRSLRIFPIYYLLLLLMVVFDVENTRSTFWWHALYGSNIYFWLEGAFTTGYAHFWSLAVEEQFYLIWPLVVLLSPTKHLQKLFAAGILLAFVFRLVATAQSNELARVLVPGCLDAFCIGGLFAYARKAHPSWYRSYVSIRPYVVAVSFLVMVGLHYMLLQYPAPLFAVGFYYLFISLVFGVWIDRVADTVSWGPLKVLLNNKGLLYLGKISYGLYLFHPFIPNLYDLRFPAILEPYAFQLTLVLRFALLIAFTTCSWYLFELPINKLKRYFSYSASNKSIPNTVVNSAEKRLKL